MTKKSPQRPPPKRGSSPPAPPPAGGKPPASAPPVKPAAIITKPPPKRLITPTLQPRVERDRSGFQKGVITAEMRATAKGSPTAEDLLLALKHEGKPSHISDEKYLQRFARYGWDEEEDEQARQVLNKWQFETYAIDPNDPFDEIGDMALDQNAAQQQALREQYLNGEITGVEFVGQSVALYREKRAIERMLAGFDDQDSETAAEYEVFLETVLGYSLELGSDISAVQMQTFAQANLAIIEYLNEVTNGNGLQTFIEVWSQNPNGEQVVIWFGDVAEGNTGGDSFGLVPQPESADGDSLNSIYLGSDVNVATIVHEFGHHLDRWFKLRQDPAFGGEGGLTGYLTGVGDNNTSQMFDLTGGDFNLNLDLVTFGMQGFAAKQMLPAEFFADLFMTAVLDGSGAQVFSLDVDVLDADSRNAIASGSGQAFWNCDNGNAVVFINNIPYSIPCGFQTVGWENPELGSQINDFFGDVFASTQGD